MFIPKHFVVLDQNVLRLRKELAERHARCLASGDGFLLPHVTFYEMSTNADCARSTWAESLDFLSTCPDSTFVARDIHECIDEEVRTGVPCAMLVDLPATQRLRAILRAFVLQDEPLLKAVFADLKKMMAQTIDTNRAERHKEIALAHVASLKERVPRSWLTSIQQKRVPALARIVASAEMDVSVAQVLYDVVKDERTALRLMASDSALATWVHVVLAWEIWWTGLNGLENRVPKKIANDLHDLEYVHAAFLGGEIFSLEKNVNALFAALREAARLRNEQLRVMLENPRMAEMAAELEPLLLAPKLE